MFEKIHSCEVCPFFLFIALNKNLYFHGKVLFFVQFLCCSQYSSLYISCFKPVSHSFLVVYIRSLFIKKAAFRKWIIPKRKNIYIKLFIAIVAIAFLLYLSRPGVICCRRSPKPLWHIHVNIEHYKYKCNPTVFYIICMSVLYVFFLRVSLVSLHKAFMSVQ